MVMGPGENAGAVDVGDGYAVAFKVESHNHPSAVEPFQGAATGVGGILRDVFALGARPIAMLDSLRFGELESERSRYLFDHVVAGIGHYGNSIGVPTVGGEVYFEAPYEQNCLVNAMCVGLARTDEMVRAAAAGVGNAVVLMGASTGRDGIGGASVLASAELEEGDESKRPSVQIGDPFEESKLLECCLELLGEGLLVSLQDLGAAGLTSSAAEMASGGGVGIDIDVAGCRCARPTWSRSRSWSPSRRSGCSRWSSPPNVERVLAICEKWQTAPAVVGEVTDRRPVPRPARRRGRRRDAGRGARRRLPALRPRAGGAGGLDLRQRARRWRDAGDDAAERRIAARRFSPRPRIASKRWAFEQYDSIVGSRTVRRPESADAAVLQPARDRRRDRASIDGNGRRVACDPYAGTIEAVLECAQNLACVGAEPLGLTNCLNFGNPEKPAVAWQLDRSTQGLADACEALGVPVVGGNVSLYNETEDGPIYPTPVVGHGRRAARPASAPAAWRLPTATRSRLSARSRPRSPARSWRSCAASSARACRRCRSTGSTARDRRGPRGGPRRGAWRPPTTSPTAASPARWPRWRSPAASALEADLDALVEARGVLRRDGAVRRGARRLPRSPAIATRAGGPGQRPGVERVRDRPGGRRADRDLGRRGREPSVALADAEAAWRSLGERFAEPATPTRNERRAPADKPVMRRALVSVAGVGAADRASGLLVLQRWVAETKVGGDRPGLGLVRDRRHRAA